MESFNNKRGRKELKSWNVDDANNASLPLLRIITSIVL